MFSWLVFFTALGSNYLTSGNSTFILTNGSEHQIRVAAGMVGNIQPRLVNEGPLQTDGRMILEGAANRNTASGIIKGNGVTTLTGSAMANEGTISPGNSAGDLDITATVTSSNTSIYGIELGGTIVGTEFDQLRVGGSFTLDGHLEVSLINGFIPAPTDSFTIMTGNTIAGMFDNVSAGRVNYDFGSFDLIKTTNSVTLQNEIIPEPSSALLLLVSSGTLLMRRRRG